MEQRSIAFEEVEEHDDAVEDEPMGPQKALDNGDL